MRARKSLGCLYAAITATALTFVVPAQGEEDISFDHASVLAATCFACHGTDGRLEHDGLEPLAGRSREGLLAILVSFREDQVPNATVMNRIASGYSEAELDAIALYFSILPAGRD